VKILGPHAELLQRTPGRNPAYKPRPHSIGIRALLERAVATRRIG
jgi:hypothetical protein